MEIAVSFKTIIFLTFFFVLYLYYLLHHTVKSIIDLYDLLLLLLVIIIPAAFTYFPKFTHKISQSLGITFPFVLLFGLLFAVVFIYFNRLVKIIRLQKDQITKLTQETGLQRLKVEELEKKHALYHSETLSRDC